MKWFGAGERSDRKDAIAEYIMCKKDFFEIKDIGELCSVLGLSQREATKSLMISGEQKRKHSHLKNIDDIRDFNLN